MNEKKIIQREKAKELTYYDSTKVSLEKFKNEEGKIVKFFKRKDGTGNVPSRSAIWTRREPFEAPPEIQILIDSAAEYGSRVDDNIEDFILGKLTASDILKETYMSIENVSKENFVWVDRSVMVCHPDGIAYGEIDELLYHPETDTYYVGDTKTSSKADKFSYWFQIAMYIEILRKLNPDKNISGTAIINHVKIKYFKWRQHPNERESAPERDVKPTHPRYHALWYKDEPLAEPEVAANKLYKHDVEKSGVLTLVQRELHFIKKMIEMFPDKFRGQRTMDVIENIVKPKETIAEKDMQLVTMAISVDTDIQKEYIRLTEEI